MPLLSCGHSFERLVLVGDHEQLEPVAFSKEGKDAWSKTLFEACLERGWRSTLLNQNYRTIRTRVSPKSTVFYGNRVSAPRQTSDPGPFLREYLVNKGVEIQDANEAWVRLDNWTRFLDVPNSEHVTTPSGQVSNKFEANAIVALIQSITAAGIDVCEIMVVVA